MHQNKFKKPIDLFLYRWPAKVIIFVSALMASATGLLAPYLQQNFLIQHSYWALLFCCIATFAYFLFTQITQYLSQKESTYTQEALSEVLYEKMLSLNHQTSSKKTIGEMVSLYATDVPSCTMWIEQTLPYILTTFIPLILTPIALQHFYDIALLESFAVVALISAVNVGMAYRQSLFFKKFKQLAAERMGLVNEWIQNIKNLRIANWSAAYEKIIIKKRVEETDNRIAMVTNGQLMNSFSSSITFWLNLAVLTYFIIHNIESVKKEDILILIWVVGVFLARPLRQLPWLLTFYFDAKTSYHRLMDFYSIVNQEPVIKKDFTPPELRNQNLATLVHIKNLNLVIDDHHILKNINLSIAKGEMISLIGPVGSGKSLLMKCLLKEMAFTADEFYCARASYLSQEPFIFSSTIQNNIAFDYDEHNYSADDSSPIARVLGNVAFREDLKNFPEGLKTHIGERGLNISGGQKQRLHLARLFFEENPLFLLDDPFSAVDTSTEQHLINALVSLKKSDMGFLVITQRYEFLQHCDRIIFLDDGVIEFDGSYEELIKIDKYKAFVSVKVKSQSEVLS